MSRHSLSPEDIINVSCASDERETTVQFSYNEKTAYIFTSDNTMITKLRKCVVANPDQWKCYEGSRDADGNLTGYFFEAPKKLVAFRKASVSSMTDEQKAAFALRMAACRGSDEDSEDSED